MTPMKVTQALCMMASAALLSPPARAQEQTGSSFFESFDSFSIRRWLVSDGWTNGPHQNCEWSRKAMTVRDGVVTLQFLPSGGSATPNLCGEIQTNEVFHYGTYEARLRTDSASGINAAFFTYIGPVHKQPHDEIDFEVLTHNTAEVSLNTYVDGKPHNGLTVPLPHPAEQDYITYSFRWEKDRIRWYVDGVLMHEATGANLPTHPQKIYLSHWGTDTLTDWMGPFTDPGRALNMDIDWVAFTAGGEPCAFPDSVLCAPGSEGTTP